APGAIYAPCTISGSVAEASVASLPCPVTAASTVDPVSNVSYASGPLTIGLRLFPRPDFEYIASGRAAGRPPDELSHAFRHAGYYVMREGWGANDQYLLFDAGFYGSGHQHEDKLNFIFWAGGRCLIGDPGIYRYSADEFEDYFRSSRGHNVIQVDGKGQARRLLYDSQNQSVEEQVPDPNTVWVPGGACDYAAGSYKNGFATRLHPLWSGESRDDERATLDTNIQHARALFYVKGEYLVVRDLLLGEGEHGVEQSFHLAPIVESLSPEGVRPGRAVVDGWLGVRTAEADLGNVAIIPGQTEGRTLRFACGDRRPAAGYTCLYGERPAIDVIYEQRAVLPLALDTVILPMDAGRPECPRLAAQPLEVGEGVALRLQWPEQTDLILLSDDGQAELRAGELAAQARALWIRTDAAGKFVRGAGVQVEGAEYRGQTLRDLAS
ncbi:MAG: heparinase II/III-family protein, partial [Armatimonadetes bacterium]|nr:heparinase II/III-family protein [Armatimonadota bacterium]